MTPEAPEHLDAAAVAKWAEIVDTLPDCEQGTLDAAACYCQAWSRWTAAEEQIIELGSVVKSPQGFPVANPYVAIAAAAQRQMRQWGAELRLTPKSRSRRKTDPAADPVLRLLGG